LNRAKVGNFLEADGWTLGLLDGWTVGRLDGPEILALGSCNLGSLSLQLMEKVYFCDVKLVPFF
jgi:hypothetical protein